MWTSTSISKFILTIAHPLPPFRVQYANQFTIVSFTQKHSSLCKSQHLKTILLGHQSKWEPWHLAQLFTWSLLSLLSTTFFHAHIHHPHSVECDHSYFGDVLATYLVIFPMLIQAMNYRGRWPKTSLMVSSVFIFRTGICHLLSKKPFPVSWAH